MNEPLIERYGSHIMASIWSWENRTRIYRRLWLELAKAQKRAGLFITDEQIRQLEQVQDVDIEERKCVAAHEAECNHEIIAHIRTVADLAPDAAKIIHVGATSCYITDNADLIQISHSLVRLKAQLQELLRKFKEVVLDNIDKATIAYTHFQPAQLTTWGKRFCIYLNDILMDLRDIEYIHENMRLRGVQGAVGTQSGLIHLFSDDQIEEINQYLAEQFSMPAVYTITGQTYTRKVDSQIIAPICRIGQSAHKFGVDMRLLAGKGEILEEFTKEQVGSSAMPYKKNPMKCERLCGLSRYLMSLESNFSNNHSNQWLERTLDDSSNRRLTLPAIFLAADAILGLYSNILTGLSINYKKSAEITREHFPSLLTESILMRAVQKGGDRQKLHDRLRVHIMEAQHPHDIMLEIAADPQFSFLLNDEFKTFMSYLTKEENHIRYAQRQVMNFIEDEVTPALEPEL